MKFVILRKTGGFYSAYDDSALIVGYVCNFKVKSGKTGFPLSSIEKVTSLLESYKVNYIIKEKEVEVSKKDFKTSNKYDSYLKKGRMKNNINVRVDNILKEIDDLSYSKADELLTIIENFIYEQ